LTRGGEGQLKERFFLEDLFYPHKNDRNNTSRSGRLTYQLTLYFRDISGHDRPRKLELWFRKDDREKRNEWAHKIQDIRLRIDQYNKQLIRDNQANQITVNVPYYAMSECIFPEVQYVGITTHDKNADEVKWDIIPAKEAYKKAKAELHDQFIKWTNEITIEKFYHIRFNENPTNRRNQNIFGSHSKSQIAYNIEFINTEGNVCFYFDHTDYRSNGPYQVGPNQPREFILLYGFTFTSIPTSTVKPDTELCQNIKELGYSHELEIRHPHEDSIRQFKNKLNTLVQNENCRLDERKKMSQSAFRDRMNTDPLPARPQKNAPSSSPAEKPVYVTEETKNIEQHEMRDLSTSTHAYSGSEGVYRGHGERNKRRQKTFSDSEAHSETPWVTIKPSGSEITVIKETPDNGADTACYSNAATSEVTTAPPAPSSLSSHHQRNHHHQQPATSFSASRHLSHHRTSDVRITRSGSAEIHRPSDTRAILENIQDNNQDRSTQGHQ
jgi:hypothetical protein